MFRIVDVLAHKLATRAPRTRAEQTARDARYDDWRAVYSEEIHDRVKHWGDKRKRAARVASVGQLDGNLFAPGGDNE